MELLRRKSTVLWNDFPVERMQTDPSTETMFIRKMVDYVASDIQNGEELTNTINKTIDDVILRDLSESLLSEKANEFINSTKEPPTWLINLCKAPIGKALFLYVLKDPILHERLVKGNYNGLVDFFISTLILNATDLNKELKDIGLTCCTLSTSILFFERVLNQFETASSYEDCDSIINSFIHNYTFSSPEELVIFFNYVIEVENACNNTNLQSLLEVFIERTFTEVCNKYSVTPILLCILSGTTKYQTVYKELQGLLNGDFSHVSSVLGLLQQLPPDDLNSFYDNRLYGLVIHYIFQQLITIQFANSHFLDIIVQFLFFLLTKDIHSPQSLKEQKELISVLRLCTSRDAVRFRNDTVKTQLLKVCGEEGAANSSISWFYREFCMQWLSFCCNETNVKNFSEEAISFFIDLLFVLAKSDSYKERVVEVILCTQDIYPNIGKRVKEYIVSQLKEGYLCFTVNLLTKCCKRLNPLTIMSYLCSIITIVEMPYPTEVTNAIVKLLLFIAPSFKGAVDNTVKGHFFEFLEKCQELKGTGNIDDELLDSVIKEFSSVIYYL